MPTSTSPASPHLFADGPPRGALVQVRLSDEERRVVHELAESEGVTISRFLRGLIAEHMRVQSEPQAAA